MWKTRWKPRSQLSPPVLAMNKTTGSTVAILLAAGESRRMKELKALLPWQGSVLLRHQVQSLLGGGVDQVVVVFGHRAGELIPLVEGVDGASWVINPDYMLGKTTSLKVGVAAAKELGPQDVLILNVDQPRQPTTIRLVLDCHRQQSGLITSPAFQGKGGHPIVVSASLLDELAQVDEATLGLKAVTQRHETEVDKVELGIPEVLWDLNTPEDYQDALKQQG